MSLALRAPRLFSKTPSLPMRQNEHKSVLLDLLHTSFTKQSARPVSPQRAAFANWKLAELKQECRRLGLVTSRSKQGLIDLLNAYYAKQPNTEIPSASQRQVNTSAEEVIEISDSTSATSSSEIEVISQTPRQKSLKPPHFRQSKKLPSTSESCDIVLPQLERLSLKESVSSSGSDTGTSSSGGSYKRATRALQSHDIGFEAEADIYGPHQNGLDGPLCAAIKADEKLYERILLLEPVSLDEMMGVAHRCGVLSGISTRDRAQLRTWLDSQCICFYEADL